MKVVYNLVDDAAFYRVVVKFWEISSFSLTPIPTSGQPVDNFVFPLMNMRWVGMTKSSDVDESAHGCSYPHWVKIRPQAVPTPLG